jgi:hypothetical protein
LKPQLEIRVIYPFANHAVIIACGFASLQKIVEKACSDYLAF